MATLPTTFINLSDIYERIEYLEDVVKVLADSIQKVNDSNKVLSDVIKQILEDKKHNGKSQTEEQDAEQTSKGQAVIQSKQQVERVPETKVRHSRRKGLDNS